MEIHQHGIYIVMVRRGVIRTGKDIYAIRSILINE